MAVELQLQAALLTGGLERVSWWNGRVLTAEDLRDAQRASEESDRRLGRALGAGVVGGLGVTPRPDRRSVAVAPGLGIDAAGEVLELPDTAGPTVVHLVPPASGSAPPGADFVACHDAPDVPLSASGTGVYLLTLASATGTKGSAPAAPSATTGSAAPTGCGPRYSVAGIQFRLVPLDLGDLAETAGHDKADLDVLGTIGNAAQHSRLRNVVAHVLLDSLPAVRTALDPLAALGATAPWRGALAGGLLSDCEVPLAVLLWAPGGVVFLDCWPVRRPPSAVPATWPAQVLGPPAAARGLATLLQLQEHLSGLLPASSSEAPQARTSLRYVPAAFLLPVPPAAADAAGFAAAFLDGQTVSDEVHDLASGRLWPLLAASALAPVVDLDSAGTWRRYRVPGASEARPFVVLVADALRHFAGLTVNGGVL